MSTRHALNPVAAMLASSMLLTCTALQAQSARAPARQRPPSAQAQIDQLRKQLEAQAQELQNMRSSLGEQDARYRQLEQTLQAERQARDAALARVVQPEPTPAQVQAQARNQPA